MVATGEGLQAFAGIHLAMRIVSLLPSATEIIYALGLEPVGVSHECNYPPEVTEKPAINHCRVDPDAGSADIHDQVLRAEREHGSVYEIDLEALRAADPDLIITQGVCDVCAVDSVLVEDAVERIDLDTRILTIDPHTLEEILEEISHVGEATGTEERAAKLTRDLRERIDAVESTADGAASNPKVTLFDWMDPVMVAGHWIPEMVEIAGGQYGITDPGEYSVPREWNDVLEFNPEILIVAPCGFTLEQTVESVDDLTTRDDWETLAAVRDERVYAMEGHEYFNRSGPRMVDSLEYLAGIIHPEVFESPPRDVVHPISARTPA